MQLSAISLGMATSPVDNAALEPLRLEPLSPDEPLTDAVYRSLRSAITEGRLAPNTKLAQIPLATQLGISRTPVRDALQRLFQDGLVRAVAYRGFAVNEVSTREVVDVYEARLALEPLALESAVPNHTNLTIAYMLDICEATERVPPDEISQLYDLNLEFHKTLLAPSTNAVYVRLLEQLWQMPAAVRVFHAQGLKGRPLTHEAEEHMTIVEAVRERDTPLAVDRLREHIRIALQQTVDALDGDD